MGLRCRPVKQRRPAFRPFATLDDWFTRTAVGQRGIFDPHVIEESGVWVEHAGIDVIRQFLRQLAVALRFFVFTEQGRHLRQIMVVAVHIAGLIDRFLQQRVTQQLTVVTAVFGKFHHPVAAFPTVSDVFIQLLFVDKTKDCRIVTPGFPGSSNLCWDLEAVILAFTGDVGVVFQSGKGFFLVAIFHRKQHFTAVGIVGFIAGRAVFRYAVAVMIAVSQPPVVICNQLWIHLFEPGLILGDVVDFHYRPGSQAWLGVTLVPVAAVAAALGAKVPGNQVGNESGVLRANGIAGFNLP